jgi:hypothetical protein
MEVKMCDMGLPCGKCSESSGAAHEVSPPSPDWAENWAKDFHDTYERAAPKFGYETRKESAKPWAEVPENNRKLMIAVCAEVLCRFEKWRLTSGAAPSPPPELFDRFPSMDANVLIRIYSVACEMASGAAQEVSPREPLCPMCCKPAIMPVPPSELEVRELKAALNSIIEASLAIQDSSPCHICRPRDEYRHEEGCPIFLAERLLLNFD